MLLKLSIRSAGSVFQIVGTAWRRAQLSKLSWPQYREAVKPYLGNNAGVLCRQI